MHYRDFLSRESLVSKTVKTTRKRKYDGQMTELHVIISSLNLSQSFASKMTYGKISYGPKD